jgi:hypothetical protein
MDHYAVFSEYSRDAINGGAPATIEHEDWDVVKELQKYLLSNNFRFKYLDAKELQQMMTDYIQLNARI